MLEPPNTLSPPHSFSRHVINAKIIQINDVIVCSQILYLFVKYHE